MKRKKWTRLRACGRWGVWVCTGLLVVAIPVSFLYEPGVMITKRATPSGAAINYYSVDIIDGRLLIRHFQPLRYSWDEPVGSKRRFEIEFRSDGYFVWVPDEWWGPPQVLEDHGFPTLVDLPIVYLFTVGIGFSILVWLLHFRSWMMCLGLEGVQCLQCGYSLEGLTSDVCPECGETHEA